jgi:hypothetical protein
MEDKKFVKLDVFIYQLAVIPCIFVIERLAQKLKFHFHSQCCDYDRGKFHNNQLLGDGDRSAHIFIVAIFLEIG